jgi:hypothetical protein
MERFPLGGVLSPMGRWRNMLFGAILSSVDFKAGMRGFSSPRGLKCSFPQNQRRNMTF